MTSPEQSKYVLFFMYVWADVPKIGKLIHKPGTSKDLQKLHRPSYSDRFLKKNEEFKFSAASGFQETLGRLESLNLLRVTNALVKRWGLQNSIPLIPCLF